MSFDPNQLLNNPATFMSLKGQLSPKPAEENPDASQVVLPPPPHDRTMYENAYGRLGLLSIANVADLGCGVGNFTDVMVRKNQRFEVYIGVDMSHNNIKTCKATYPGWSFVYGDFHDPSVRQLYERYEAYLLLNVMDVLDDELAFLDTVPSQKPILFSMPRFPKEGSARYFDDPMTLRERYSNHLSIRSIGRCADSLGDNYSMVVGVRW